MFSNPNGEEINPVYLGGETIQIVPRLLGGLASSLFSGDPLTERCLV